MSEAVASEIASSSAHRSSPRRSSPRPRRLRGHPPGVSPWWGVLFIGPTALGLGVFYLWPIVRSVWMSFQKSGAFGGYSYVGLQNYVTALNDPYLMGALRNTFLFTGIGLLGVPIAVAVAALLNTRGLAGKSFYRVLYFLPVVTMPAAISLVWRMIYNGESGVLNSALRVLGITGPSWLTDPRTALAAIAVVGIWAGLGTSIVIFMAALQGVPETLLEAAELDGAGPLRRFWSVTVPMISPAIFFVTVISVIGSLQTFDLVYLMITRVSPVLPDTRTVVFLFYEASFANNQRGLGAAIAIILMAIILVLTVIQFWLQKKWVHYD